MVIFKDVCEQNHAKNVACHTVGMLSSYIVGGFKQANGEMKEVIDVAELYFR
jgi:hypothetical protein